MKAEVRKPLPNGTRPRSTPRPSKPAGDCRYLTAKSGLPSSRMGGLMKARSCDSSCNPLRLTGKPVGLFGFLWSFFVILFFCLGAHCLKLLFEDLFNISLRRGVPALVLPVLLFMFCSPGVLAEKSPGIGESSADAGSRWGRRAATRARLRQCPGSPLISIWGPPTVGSTNRWMPEPTGIVLQGWTTPAT